MENSKTMFLECTYQSCKQINLNEVAQSYDFNLEDIMSLSVKWSTLYINLNNGQLIEHEIDLDGIEQTIDYKRPSETIIFDEKFVLQENPTENILDFPFKEK